MSVPETRVPLPSALQPRGSQDLGATCAFPPTFLGRSEAPLGWGAALIHTRRRHLLKTGRVGEGALGAGGSAWERPGPRCPPGRDPRARFSARPQPQQASPSPGARPPRPRTSAAASGPQTPTSGLALSPF